MIKGIIFDMDGTLFNTEYVNDLVQTELFSEAGYTIPEGLLDSIRCCSAEVSKPILQKAFGQDFNYEENSQKRRERMKSYFEKNGLPKKAGVNEILSYLQEKGYPMAIASATEVDTVKYYLKLAGIDHYFTAIIGGDLITNMKPHPEIFTMAAQALGLHPNETIAIEDSPNGVHSASAAGCHTIMVPDIIPANNELKALSEAVVPSLNEALIYIQNKQ